MNYYSRNSPVRKRLNPQPGFLIPSRRGHSSRGPSTARSANRLRSHFDLSSRHSFQSQEEADLGEGEMLVLDDDVIYVAAGDQIFIDEGQDQQEKEKGQQGRARDVENQALEQHEANLSGQSVNQNKETQTDPILEQQGQQQQQLDEDKQGLDKYFFRNYSFGDKQFAKSQVHERENKKQPLIRQMINMQSLPKLENRTRANRDNFGQVMSLGSGKGQAEGRNPLHRSLRTRIETQQTWSKIVKNFIKKRKSSEQQKKTQQQSENNANIQFHRQIAKPRQKLKQKQKQVQKQIQKQIQIQSQNQKEDRQSQGSGYFPSDGGDKLFKDEPEREHVIVVYDSNQIRIEDDEEVGLPLFPALRQDDSKANPSYPQPQSPLAQTFSPTTNLLSLLIPQLPPPIIPKFLQIEAERTRKIHQAEITTRRMQQTQRMLQMLIQAHRKRIYVDRYLLGDGEFGDDAREQVEVNREVIMALVRKLGGFL